jgi:hypothetical protein
MSVRLSIPTDDPTEKNVLKKDIRDTSVSGSAAFDIVEYIPSLDVSDMTVFLMAELVLEMITGEAYRRKNG